MVDPVVAVDAMSGDNDPQAAVWGAVEASLQSGPRVLLVGDPAALRTSFDAWCAFNPASSARARRRWEEQVEIVASDAVIGMDEHPAHAVRAKRNASVVVATRLIAEGRAGAAVSAGNSGATLAAALFTLKRVAGVERPAIGAAFPTPKSDTFLLDVGANVDCKPEWLLQFEVMGGVYARLMMGVNSPRIGLLSNGEEAEKGSDLVREAHRLLGASSVGFTGNVEGRDLFSGACDVVVTDGFTGNAALKTAEGAAEFLFGAISRQVRSSLTGRVGGALLKPRLRPIRDRVDYRKTGGALLLGVAGEVVIAHGRSDAEAMGNAVRVAERAIRQQVSRRIGEALAAETAGAGAGDASERGVLSRS